MRFLDTNIIIRYLTKDDPVKAADCFDLFQRLKEGKEKVLTCEAILTEVVYVLSSPAQYNLSHEEIRARLSPILPLKGLKLPKKRLYVRALDIYALYPFLDFEDALSLAYMEKADIQELLSYDRDFDRIPNTRRVEP